MLASGVGLLTALAPRAAHVVDLAGGTGALSAAVRAKLPEARVTLLDVDSAMLGEAQRRLAPGRGADRVP
jgi:ubiquinone/menaquinone biosynthesis C-methylase UbiE